MSESILKDRKIGLKSKPEPGEVSNALPYRRPKRKKGGASTGKVDILEATTRYVSDHQRLVIVKRILDTFNTGNIGWIKDIILEYVNDDCMVSLPTLGIQIVGGFSVLRLLASLFEAFPNGLFLTSDTTVDDEGKVCTRFSFSGTQVYHLVFDKGLALGEIPPSDSEPSGAPTVTLGSTQGPSIPTINQTVELGESHSQTQAGIDSDSGSEESDVTDEESHREGDGDHVSLQERTVSVVMNSFSMIGGDRNFVAGSSSLTSSSSASTSLRNRHSFVSTGDQQTPTSRTLNVPSQTGMVDGVGKPLTPLPLPIPTHPPPMQSPIELCDRVYVDKSRPLFNSKNLYLATPNERKASGLITMTLSEDCEILGFEVHWTSS